MFVRCVTSRGYTRGAVAAAVDLTVLLDAAGVDVVLIETVGTGEGEVDVARQADVVVLVMAPSFGNAKPAQQASVFEFVDVFALNKSDQPGADELECELKLLAPAAHRDDGWFPPVIRTIATEGRGIEQLVSCVRTFQGMSRNSTRGVDTWALRLGEMLRDHILHCLPHAELCRGAQDIVERRRDPYTIVGEWLGRMQIPRRF